MKNRLLFVFLLLGAESLFSQSVDTNVVNLNTVVITATRTEKQLLDIPAQADLISADEIAAFPLSNLDDILKTTANVNVNRSWGIFSKNAAVTMRGLEGSDRVLVLIDGIPKNSLVGGSVNWHNIFVDELQKIEVVKGPVSALYGNNAMGGVINMITKIPEKKLEGSVKAFYGTYNTIGSSVSMAGNEIEDDKGYYWSFYGNYRHGDGYVFEAPDYIDETDVRTALDEAGGGAKIGYRLNRNHRVELVVDNYNETRGGGTKVFTSEGSFDKVFTNNLRFTHYAKVGKADIVTSLFWMKEDYYSQKESMNDFAEYRLMNSYSNRTDNGLVSTLSMPVFKKQLLTTGLEFKSGSSHNHETYRTSPDEITSSGKMDIMGVFIQDEASFLKNRMKAIVGFRFDAAGFYDGGQTIIDPTKATGFTEGFHEEFDRNNWLAFSPKASLQYKITEFDAVYISAGVGFKPPKLKDLSQSGKINKGFRLANPNLKPEYLTNYELGFAHVRKEKMRVNAAVYYAFGHDFQYSVSTGDSVDTGGNTLKPVLIADNIGKVEIIGLEISSNYLLTKQLSFQLSYSFNHSIIKEYKSSMVDINANLNGKEMAEVSPHLFYAGLTWENRYFSFQMNGNYVDKQWFDPENTMLVDGYFLLNAKISKSFFNHYYFAIEAQNLLDNQYVDRKGQLSPGRFMTAVFMYRL
ncbi:MAG: TonB-dependent receptor [Bacteroidales bacterium]|nr:TonB-dependent receptor [Bacteroidales bacterium]